MKKLQFAAATAALVALTAGIAHAATPAPAAPAPAKAAPPAAAKPAGPSDKAQIDALWKGFVAAFDAKNADKIMTFYARKGLFVFDAMPPREYVGWEAYKKDWQGLFSTFPGPMKIEIEEPSVTIVGSVAYGHNAQHGHFTGADGAVTEIVVRVSDVYRKIGDRWQIVQEHVSVPVDLATGKADMLSKP